MAAMALVFVASAPAASAVAGVSGVSAQDGGALDSPALSRLASCVAGQKQLAVVLLVDESGSLRETDPNNDRVAAARAALLGLESLVERSDGQVRVDLQVAGFGVDFEEAAPWATLGPDSVAEADERIGAFSERNRALDTDYTYALQGALASVRTRATQMTPDGGQPPCTAVMWFTDGRFDVEDRISAARRESGRDNRGDSQYKEYAPGVDLYQAGGGVRAVEQGKQVLCEAGGLADQFRSSETSLFAVALNTAIEPQDQEFLAAVAAGGLCGELDGSANGELLAGDLNELVGFFDQVVTALSNPASSDQVELTTCPDSQEACPQGTKTFEVDGSLQRFHVLAQTDAPGVAVRLSAPSAAPVDVPVAGSGTPAGSLAAGETPITWAWLSGNALTVDAESSPGGENWAGTWSVTFIDTTGTNPGAPVRAQIYLFGDVVPTLAEGTEFRAGDATEFTAELVRSAGTPIPPTSLSGDVRLTATVTDPSTGETVDLGALERQSDGTWRGEYRAPEQITSSTVNLSLRTDVTTASGVALAPSAASVPVTVLPPVGFPSVASPYLGVGPIVGTDPLESTIRVTGSDKADTCVWVDSLALDPGAVDRSGLAVEAIGAGATEADCLQIPKGEDAQLSLRFAATEPQRGLATGTIVLATRSANTNEVRPIEVQLDAQLVKPANAGTAWALFALLVLLGIGVPVALFYLSNWIVGRFAPLRLMEGCAVRMAVTDTSVERLEPPENARLLVPDDFRAVGGTAERERDFDFAGMHFRAVVSRNPFQPPFGLATMAGLKAVGSAKQPTHANGGRIPLWVTREWVFVPDEVTNADDPVTGLLVGFVLATDRLAGCDALELRLVDRLPAIAELCRRVRPVAESATAPEPVPAGAAASDPPWGDGPSGSGAPDPGALWDRGGGSDRSADRSRPPDRSGPNAAPPTAPPATSDRPDPEDLWGD